MNRLRDMREDMDLRLADVASAVNLSVMSMSYYEREERQLTADTIRVLCDFYDCSADYLLGLSNVRNPAKKDPVSEFDTGLAEAYHRAPPEIRTIIDTALAPYKEDTRREAAG